MVFTLEQGLLHKREMIASLMSQGRKISSPTETTTLDDISKFCIKFGHLILRKIMKFVATRCQILRLKCTKFDFGWVAAPHLAGEPTAPQTP